MAWNHFKNIKRKVGAHLRTNQFMDNPDWIDCLKQAGIDDPEQVIYVVVNRYDKKDGEVSLKIGCSPSPGWSSTRIKIAHPMKFKPVEKMLMIFVHTKINPEWIVERF